MTREIQVSFRNMEPSPYVEAAVRRRAAWLERYCDRIHSCRIMVETPHRHHRKGALHHVRIDIGVPGAELVVGREAASHTNVYVAIREAFHAARRELQAYQGR